MRELTAAHGVVLVFDEVKTGAHDRRRRRDRALRRPARRRLPGQGDRRRLPQRRGRDDRDARRRSSPPAACARSGTFNGNPLVDGRRAGGADRGPHRRGVRRASRRANARLRAGLDDVIERYGLPCHTVGLGRKGCVVFSSEPLYEYRDYATKVDEELSTLAWLYHMNHGIFMTPGVDEQWTLCVAHSDDELQRYVDAYRGVCARRDRGVGSRHAHVDHLRLVCRSAPCVATVVLALVAPGGGARRWPSSSRSPLLTAAGRRHHGRLPLGWFRTSRSPDERKREALTRRFKRGRPEWETTPPDHADEHPDTAWERERERRGLR